MRCITLIAGLALAVAPSGCNDSKKRPVGAVCGVHAQCESGVCGGGFCLTPDGDEDGDGLINIVEAALGTDPVNADTDGDGKPDAVEVGDPENPTDTDGDGKIDAIESAIEDVDGDCIPDELDANDDFSDLPSDAFPHACGNGRPFPDPTPGPLTCESVRAILGGTCAEALGRALVECFDPAGCVSVESNPDGPGDRIVWENGAYQTFDEASGQGALYSSRGQLCVAIEDTDEAGAVATYTYRASGQSWTITVYEDDSADVRCANGTVVRVSAAETEAIGDCQGSGDFEFCDGPIPDMCTSTLDCPSGQECCDFSEFRFCAPTDSCP